MYKFKEDNMLVPCFVWSNKEEIEQSAIDQIKNASSLPFAYHHTVLCPDAHLGYGAPIGGILTSTDVIIPNFVGSDIGCGLTAIKSSLKEISRDTIKKIMEKVKRIIPVGFMHHKHPQANDFILPGEFGPIISQEEKSIDYQIGTLGGGNHFIEIQQEDNGCIWIMIHSGSRNLGFKVAKFYNDVANTQNKKWYSSVPKEWELAFLPIDSSEARMYIIDMKICVEFAHKNRQKMMFRMMDLFKNCVEKYDKNNVSFKEEPIDIAHNYVALENHYGKNVWVHRKGATLARKETIGIIPGSQGTASYIVKGKGNPESFMSCSHGAGRTMSRTRARKELDLVKEKKKLDDQGIIHSIRNQKDLDEASSAYKDIDTVMSNQEDLVEILVKLKPLAVIKG